MFKSRVFSFLYSLYCYESLYNSTWIRYQETVICIPDIAKSNKQNYVYFIVKQMSLLQDNSLHVISAYQHWCCEFESNSGWGVLDTTLCDKVCHVLAAGRWFYPGTPVSSTNKTDHHYITDILLKVALNTINPNPGLHSIK
jgi:hypothetical protein